MRHLSPLSSGGRPLLSQRRLPLQPALTTVPGRSLVRAASAASLRGPPPPSSTSSHFSTARRPSLAFAGTASCATRSYSRVSAAELKFGQPLHETHPHILNAGELTPGITAQEYADRRAALAQQLPIGAIAVLPAASLKYKSGAVFFPYRQESNFLWLTGWNEPEAVACIERTGPQPDDYGFHMLVKPKNPAEEQWSGYRNGIEAARDVFNADDAFSVDLIDSVLPKILASSKLVYFDQPKVPNGGDSASPSTSPEYIHKNMLLRRNPHLATTPLSPVMNKLRVVKSPAEIENMRRAGRISGRAITKAMTRSWQREKDLHAFLDYEFTVNGCDGPAYIPVVAGGERANCIHYTVNNDVFQEGELVLVDAGGEYGSYNSDISRTWPVSGKFTPPQRDLYEAVLKVQRTCVSLCRASAGMSLEDIHNIACRALADQLKALDFPVSTANISELFPHHVGHYIGVDLHDCPGLSRRETLRSGVCVTIEPGVYVPDDPRWPRHFRGMGVRIEDSVCVDDDSPLVLSVEAVKEIDDIEALRD